MSAGPKLRGPVPRGLADEELALLSSNGDASAMDELLDRHREGALRIAERIVGRGEAEDVVQDSFLLACRFIASLKDPSKFDRWLNAIVRFRAMREFRREKRWGRGRVAFDEGVEATVSLVDFSRRKAEEGDAELLEALSRMPPEYADVLRYHFLHGLPHQEIADLGGVPLSTVKYRCSRGKELLRAALREMRAPLPACVREACAKCQPARDGGRCAHGPRPAGRALARDS